MLKNSKLDRVLPRMPSSTSLTVGVVGDVMIGRGIDAILPHSVNPTIHESYMKSALGYVRIAEKVNGPLSSVPERNDELYVWGDLLQDFKTLDLFIYNLETTLSISEDYIPKGINYRCHPKNINTLKNIGINKTIATIANNHIFDWGVKGFLETLDTLSKANIPFCGAGRNSTEATRPSMVSISSKSCHNPNYVEQEDNTQVFVSAVGSDTAGVPLNWAASESHPGVYLIEKLDIPTANMISENAKTYVQLTEMKSKEQVREVKAADEECVVMDDKNVKKEKELPNLHENNIIMILSIHWGSNWGWGLKPNMQLFAHELIKQGMDVVVGHSSHHVKGIEVYQNKLILYGCGDFLNDYEGISDAQYSHYRADLCCLYRIRFSKERFEGLDIIPCQIKHLRVQGTEDKHNIEWLRATLCREGAALGTWVEVVQDPETDKPILQLRWADQSPQ